MAKTSIYLTEQDAARVAASGLTLPELIRRSLDLDERFERIEKALTELVLAVDGLGHDDQGRSIGRSQETRTAARNAAGLLGIELPSTVTTAEDINRDAGFVPGQE